MLGSLLNLVIVMEMGENVFFFFSAPKNKIQKFKINFFPIEYRFWGQKILRTADSGKRQRVFW